MDLEPKVRLSRGSQLDKGDQLPQLQQMGTGTILLDSWYELKLQNTHKKKNMQMILVLKKKYTFNLQWMRKEFVNL